MSREFYPAQEGKPDQDCVQSQAPERSERELADLRANPVWYWADYLESFVTYIRSVVNATVSDGQDPAPTRVHV